MKTTTFYKQELEAKGYITSDAEGSAWVKDRFSTQFFDSLQSAYKKLLSRKMTDKEMILEMFAKSVEIFISYKSGKIVTTTHKRYELEFENILDAYLFHCKTVTETIC